MKIGITRIRNESHIIKDTLDHVSKLVDEIIIYDDASEDGTVEICKNHPAVIQILRNEIWESDPIIRGRLEKVQRQLLYNAAIKRNPEWVYYFDADEFASFEGIDFKADAYRLRLFDYYITPEDKHLDWKERKYIGPEYRDILMLFRPHPQIRFTGRVPKVPKNYIVKRAGEVKHYGKAISIEEWEKTCQYYINHLNEPEKDFVEKWKSRVGKAVHTISDFGNPLITWDERRKKDIPLKKCNWRNNASN